jgi:FAD binding domain-containing protein/D-arabinono-1,4-lactone oxidase
MVQFVLRAETPGTKSAGQAGRTMDSLRLGCDQYEEGSTMTRPVIRNWNNSVLSIPKVVAVPKDVQELCEMVKDRANYPSPLRAGGSFHSLNACFVSEGTQILLSEFNDISVDATASTVTVGASVELIQIRDALRPHGMELEVSPEIGNATAGSVACCGTKDASLGHEGLGQVNSIVIGVRMVNGHGEIETVTEANDPDRMRVVRSSYGLLGLIFEVTFRIQGQSVLSYSHETFKLTSLPSRDELFGDADGVLGFCLPYSDRIVVERRRVLSGDVRISAFSRFKRSIRDSLWENAASFFTTKLPYNWAYGIFDRLTATFLVGLSRLGGFKARRPDSMINFKFNRSHYFDFTFWAIPVSRWNDFIPTYVAFCRDYLRETGFRSSLGSEVYFINKDQRSVLSFSSTEDVFTMDLVDSRPNDPLWVEFNRRYNALAAQFNARPLLNQTKQLTSDIVFQTLGHDWEQILLHREKSDPEGRFLNKYFADLGAVNAKGQGQSHWKEHSKHSQEIPRR